MPERVHSVGRSAAWVAAALSALVSAPAWGQELSPGDVELLERSAKLVGQPSEALALVQVMQPEWGWTGRRERRGLGWLVGEGDEARVVFLGGLELPAPPPEQRDERDLVAGCQTFYVQGEPVPWLEPSVNGFPRQHPLVHATWLHLLGEDGLAGKVLAHVREDYLFREDAGEQRLRTDLGLMTSARLLEAYLVGEDELALATGEWLMEHLPQLATRQAPDVMRSLQRRRAEGKLGAPAPTRPDEFSHWELADRLEWLMASLDEARHRDADLRTVRREPICAAILALGTRALNALADVVEHDTRMTRYMGPVTGPPQHRQLLSVRQLALQLALEILGTKRLGEGAWIADLAYPRISDPAASAEILRAYWKRHGDRPARERWLSLLEAQDSDLAQLAEAAAALADLGPVGADGTRLNHACATPTARAALALVAALRANAPWGEAFTLALRELGDPRVGPALLELAQDAELDPGQRLDVWYTAYVLGHVGPWRSFLAQLSAGSPGDPWIAHQHAVLGRVIESGIDGIPATRALLDPGHPWHAGLRDHLLQPWPGDEQGDPLRWRASWLGVGLLQELLVDPTPTGSRWTLTPSHLVRRWGGTGGGSQRAADLGGPEALEGAFEERVCDAAGLLMRRRVLGLPQVFHPLRRDREQRLEQIRDRLARHPMRRVGERERRLLLDQGLLFALDLPRLDGSATPEDVAAGRALFHLPDSVGPAWVELPALAVLAGSKGKDRRLVVQGELNGEGQVRWGLLGGPDGVAVVGAEALAGDPVPLSDPALGR